MSSDKHHSRFKTNDSGFAGKPDDLNKHKPDDLNQHKRASLLPFKQQEPKTLPSIGQHVERVAAPACHPRCQEQQRKWHHSFIMPTAAKKLSKADMPPASLNGAQWINSPAKHLMTQDMLDGLVSVDEKIKNVFKLYDTMYSHQPEFKDFPFEETRYRGRIEALQKSIGRLAWAARYDQQCLEEAKAVFPDGTHGPTGEPLWRGSQADKQLETDMANGVHLAANFKPSELHASNSIYWPFSKKRFAKRIDQKREMAKPYGNNPMQAAAKKAAKDMKKLRNRPDISRLATEGVDAYANEA